MILSDREIKAALFRGAIKISPSLREEAWSSTAIDLRLDREITLWGPLSFAGVPVAADPSHQEYNFTELQRECSRRLTISDDGYVMKAGSFLLAWTIEKVQLPHQARLAARVEGKSSLARLGLGVHVTAPTIHAGFGVKSNDPDFLGNPLQLEIWNVGAMDIRLRVGMSICQLIFETVDGTPDKGYQGRFTSQGPTV